MGLFLPLLLPVHVFAEKVGYRIERVKSATHKVNVKGRKLRGADCKIETVRKAIKKESEAVEIEIKKTQKAEE